MRRVMVRVSKDGGHTWGGWKTKSLGELGEYRKRVKFGPFGQFQQSAMMQIRVVDPLRAHLLAASASVETKE